MCADKLGQEDDVLPSNGDFQAKKGPQYLAAVVASIGAFGLGNVVAWTSPALPDIERHNDFDGLKGSSETGSWVGSIVPLGALFAGFIAGFLIEALGRKRTILALAPPFVAGWLLIAFAPNIAMVLVGRFITGFCGGAFTLIVPVYVSETAEDSLRGTLSNGMSLILCFGIFMTYLLGKWLTWQALSMVSAGVPAIMALAMFFMPETPRYLLVKGKEDEARNALKWLRGAEYDGQIESEMRKIQKSIESSQGESASFKDLLAASVVKPTLICLMLMFTQQFGGINAVIFYSVDIFKAAGTSGISDIDCAIVIGFVQFVFVIASCLLVERLGRKILLIISCLGMGVSLVALGVFFYLKSEGKESGLEWLPLTSLIAYIIAYDMGVGPLPWTLMGELLPQHVKGPTSSLATATSWGLAFVITKTFQSMVIALQPYGCYWLFGGVCFIGAAFSFFVIPETKGKSLDEIQAHFGGGRGKK